MKLLQVLASCTLAIPVLLAPTNVGAQEAFPPDRPATLRDPALRSYDPFSWAHKGQPRELFDVQLPELPKPAQPNRLADQQVKQAEQARRQREHLYRCESFVRTAMQDHKHSVALTLHDHTGLEGSVLSADSHDFVFLETTSQQEREIRYDDVAKWTVVRSPGEHALIATKDTGLILLTIPLIPILFLAWAVGLDRC